MTRASLKKFSLIEDLFASVLEATVSQEMCLSEYKKHPPCLPVKRALAFPQA